MGSNNNNQENDLQDQQANLLDETYRLGWMDGYAEGYNDGVEDTETALNNAENEAELLQEQLEQQEALIQELGSNAGKSLQALRNR
ncbi:hypothetical protein NMT03_001005 [Vibrio alginolyticus]|nr:hypothetical protein [Vibrio alginolyticus]